MNQPRILIVAESMDKLTVLENAIKNKLNVTVVASTSHDEAVVAIEKNDDFALVIIDSSLAVDKGAELAKMLKTEYNNILAVIFLSNCDFGANEEHCCAEHAVDFTKEPTNELELRLLLNKINVYLEVYGKKKLLEAEMEKRRQMEEKYRNLIEFTNTGYIIMTPDMKIVELNSNAAKLMGYDNPDEAIGSNPRSMVSCKDIERFDLAFDSLSHTKGVDNLKISLKVKSGKATFVSMNACLINSNQNKIFCMMRDITAEMQEEQQTFITKQRQKDKIVQNMRDIRSKLRQDLMKTV